MNYIKVTWVAMNSDGNRPIISADSFENLKAGLDDYYGCDGKGGEYLEFKPYYCKYPSEYQGCFTYKSTMYHSDKDQEPTVYIDEIKVYCIEFWPYTTQKK